MHLRVKEMIQRAPLLPGVYIMKDKKGAVLYVGKALRLKDRLLSYAGLGRDERPSVFMFVPKIQDIEWVITNNEKEAILLENNLIKAHSPRYNINLKDDKSYVSLRITNQEFPRMFVTRKIIQDGSAYYGPYSSARAVRETLRLAQKLFKVRDCSEGFYKSRKRPCLRYQIKRCSAPCVQLISKEDYQLQVKAADMFLNGKTDALLMTLRQDMDKAATELRYEDASRIRDRISAIEQTLEPQKVESRDDHRDADAVTLAGDEQATLIQVLRVRNGRMTGSQQTLIEEPIAAKEEILRTFLRHHYLNEESPGTIPRQVLVPFPLEDQHVFAEIFSEKIGRKAEVFVPQRGFTRKLLELSQKNAEFSLSERKRKSEVTRTLLENTRKTLGLKNLPERIEGYDISNIQGTNPVGSMVVFTQGEPDKKDYRHFTIKTVKGANDFAMMKEMLTRRFTKQENYDKPSLVLIDGGKGQLKQAIEVFRELNITDVDLLSIAKEKDQISLAGKKTAPERFFRPNQKNAIVLPPNSTVLHLLMRVRDEAHRFGITHHRKRRKKSSFDTILNQIVGIGPKRAKLLLKHLGSVERVRNSSLEDLKALPGIDSKTAAAVFNFFKSPRPEEE